MTSINRQAGETANHYHLTAEDLKNEVAFDGGNVLIDAKWKAARFQRLEHVDPDTCEDLVQDFLYKVWKHKADYNPGNGASRRTFAKGIIENEARNANRRIEKQRFLEACSLDAPIEGGKPNSHEITHLDTVREESDLMPPNLCGARRIRTETDLDLVHELMGDGVDWQIFILRWLYPVTNEELAERLLWTPGRLRWYLRGYERRYARLLGVSRRKRH